MPAHTAPYPAEIMLVPHRRRSWRGRFTLAVLGALALVAVAVNIAPGLSLSSPAQHVTHAAAARPAPPPAVKLTVGGRAYACTVAPAPRPKHAKRP